MGISRNLSLFVEITAELWNMDGQVVGWNVRFHVGGAHHGCGIYTTLEMATEHAQTIIDTNLDCGLQIEGFGDGGIQ